MSRSFLSPSFSIRRFVHCLSRLALVLVSFAGVTWGPVGAQTVDVCVDFGGFSSVIPDKIGFLARVQTYFANACYPDPADPASTLCLGPSDSTGVNFLEAAPGTGGCEIQATFICDASLSFYGDMDKLNHRLRVNLYPFIGLFAGDPDPAGRRMQAIAETLAHEVGHVLCAVHECVGPGLKPDGTACPVGPATLMSVGTCVPVSSRGIAPPNPGSRSFSVLSALQMADGIRQLDLALQGILPNWTLGNEDPEDGILRLVAGRAHFTPIVTPNLTLRGDDPDVTFHYQVVGGNEAMFEFGWLNSRQQFISSLPAAHNPDRVLQAAPGSYLHFALRGRPDCPLAGLVFPQKQYGIVTLGGASNLASRAATPGVAGVYRGQARIDFNAQGHTFAIVLEATSWGAENGFHLTPPVAPTAQIVARGAPWRYLDNGTDQGTAWRTRGFNDAAWPTGMGELGFGDNPDTVLNPGPTTNRFNTYYFRHAFPIPVPVCTNLLFRLKRDDGAVVYLNGTEVFRSHMPAGPITAATRASAPAVSSLEEEAFFELNSASAAALLVPGDNVLAVEVHQVNATDADLSFELELVGNVYPRNVPPVVSLVAPGNGARVQTGQPVVFGVSAGSAFDPDGTVNTVEYYANGALVARSTAGPAFNAAWTGAAPGVYSLTALAYDNSGASTVSVNPVAISVLNDVPPTVTILSPSNGTVFAAPASFTVSVTASDILGSVSNVQFRLGSELIGTDNTSPYSASVANLGFGTYALTAVATDARNTRNTSAPVYITVTSPMLPPNVFQVISAVGGSVNGEAVDARGVGTGDAATGEMLLDWTFTRVPVRFSIWGSLVTKSTSLGAVLARVQGNAVNLLGLTGGNYALRETALFSTSGGDPLGHVNASVSVALTGSNTLSSQTLLSGEVDLPPLVGIVVQPASWTPLPGGTSFVERVTKYLLRQDGGDPIRVDATAIMTPARGGVPPLQCRTGSLLVLSASPDVSRPASARIQYQNAVCRGAYFNGVLVSPRGNASLDPGAGQLAVGGIGAGGQDGIALALDDADYFGANFAGVSLAPNDASLTIGALGSYDRRLGTPLGTSVLTRAGNGVQVAANFDDIGASRVRVEIYSNGVLRGSAELDTGLLGTLSGGVTVTGCGKLGGRIFPPFPPCYWWRFQQPVSFGVPGANLGSGNELRILAANARGFIQNLSGFELRARNLPGWTFTGFTTTDPVTDIGPTRFDYTHVMLINGQRSIARQVGAFDFTQGVLNLRGVIDRYIPGYRRWPVSPLTLATLSGSPIDPWAVHGARTVFDLTGRNLGHQVNVRTIDSRANLTTQIYVRRKGARAIAMIATEGTADYPEIIGMESPLVYQQTPSANGLTETGNKVLIAQNGQTIPSSFTAQFLGLDRLPSPQQRSIVATVLSESADGLSVAMRLQSLLKPTSVANPSNLVAQYTHHFSINGASSSTHGAGLIDRSLGRVRSFARVRDFLPGYPDWVYSPVTLLLMSAVAVSPAEFGAAQNPFTLTGGSLGYKVAVSTRDAYADILSDINVRRVGDVVVAQVDSRGDANYPPGPAAMSARIQLSQSPSANGFTETGLKRLRAGNGELIETTVVAAFDGLAVSNSQSREVNVTIERLSEDRQTVELRFDSTLRRALPPLYLNEWMASNGGFNRDEDGDASDWFEIHNAGPFDVDPGGLYLTDNLNNPRQFQIPFGFNIPAGGHLLVWASGKDRRVPSRPLHANFLLATAGESLGLFAADGTRIDSVVFGAQALNVSQGRLPDGASNVVSFPNSPTPAAANRTGPPPVTFRGFAHTALGAASIQLAGSRLSVANLGSSGNDGVSVALGGAASFTLSLDPVSLNNNGARMSISGAGLSGGAPNFSFGQASLSNNNGVVFVNADFRPLGDPNVLVEVWNAGQLVGARTLPAGLLGRLAGNVVVTTVGKFSPSGAFPYCIPIDFLFPVTFTPLTGAGAGGPGLSLEGTQLRLLAAGAQVPVETIARFDLRFANLGGPVNILDEFRTSPQPLLNIALLGDDQVIVSWRSANYVLQHASQIAGPWEDVLSATSPYFIAAGQARQFYRLRRDLSPDEAPDIEVPPRLGRAPLSRNPSMLPQGARGDLPAFDGDPVFVSLPAREQAAVATTEIAGTVIAPLLRAMGFDRGLNGLLLPPGNGVDFPRGNLDGLAQALNFEYANNPQVAGPQTSNMLNVFLGITPPNAQIDAALQTGEGMTFAQFKAGIERLEIQYPFQQHDGGVPIEHTMLVASRWEGQSVTTVFGTLFNRYAISNRIVIVESNAVAAGIRALGGARGVEQVTCIAADDGPHLLLLPYGTDINGVTQMRYSWRMVLRADTVVGSSSFRLWLDAETGQILKLNMGLDSVTARGLVANRDPGRGTAMATFQVDPAVGGQYVLSLAGAYNRVDYLNDGYDALDVSISSTLNGSSAALANFNQGPINDLAQGLCQDGTNPGFQQVNLFATVLRGRSVAISLGVWTPYPIAPLTPNIQISGSCNADDDLNFFVCAGYTAPTCPDFVGANSGLNNALDNTVVSHEMGHTIQERLCEDRPSDWCGVPGCAISVSWQPLHDLADAWAGHLESCNCEGGWAAQNTGGLDNSLYCANHNEAGGSPRFHWVDTPFNPASPQDHFPEHRALPGAGTSDYSDMQIATAALWQVRLGMRSKCRPSGVPQYAIRWARALKNTGLTGMSPGDTDTGIYRFLYDLEQKMMDQWATAGSPGGPPAFRHNGAHTANKVAAGFARTGVFLIPFTQLDGDPVDPDNGGDAVIDITDNEPGDDYVVNGCPHAENDFLRLGGPAPTFHVWTGPRYRLDGAGGAATLNNPSPCNTKFRVEVSTDMGFAPASTINSAFFNVDTNPTTPASPEGYGTWTPSAAEWATLQAGGVSTRIYYRARTRRADDTNERLSTTPGNGVWTVPPPYAVITGNGRSDY